MARPCLSLPAAVSSLIPKPSHTPSVSCLRPSLRRSTSFLRLSYTIRLASTYSGTTELSESILAESSLQTSPSLTFFDPIERSRARANQLPPSRYSISPSCFLSLSHTMLPKDMNHLAKYKPSQKDTNSVRLDTIVALYTLINHPPHPLQLHDSSNPVHSLSHGFNKLTPAPSLPIS